MNPFLFLLLSSVLNLDVCSFQVRNLSLYLNVMCFLVRDFVFLTAAFIQKLNSTLLALKLNDPNYYIFYVKHFCGKSEHTIF